MLGRIDRLNDLFGGLAAWMFFAIGGMLAYEVVGRYVFNAPTIWAEEMSRFFQLWATYLAAATVLRRRELIRITLLLDRLGPGGRRAAEVASLLFIAGFSAVVVWYGTAIALESIAMKRATSTMLTVPKWMTEAAVPVGFALLFLQCAAGIARVLAGAPVAPSTTAESHGEKL